MLPSFPVGHRTVDKTRKTPGKLVPIDKRRGAESFRGKHEDIGLNEQGIETSVTKSDANSNFRVRTRNTSTAKQRESDVACMKRTTNRSNFGARLTQLTTERLESVGDGVRKDWPEGDEPQEECWKEKMIFVEKWIKDCERSVENEFKKSGNEVIAVSCPAWMKTAVEMRKKRNKRVHSDESEPAIKTEDCRQCNGSKNKSNAEGESIIERYLDASGTALDRLSTESEKERKASEMFIRDLKVTGVNLANVLENFPAKVFVSCCFEHDAEYKTIGILKCKKLFRN